MPSKTEIKVELAFPYDIRIIPTVNGGCIVNLGCAQLSYSTPARMIIDLKKYLAEPEKYEKAYYECNKIRPSGSNALAVPGQVVESLDQPIDSRDSEAPDEKRKEPE
jgi:hypothetical protein